MKLEDAVVVERLREHGIQPSAQRVAVARYALFTDEHPSADQVFQRVRGHMAVLSRATVYNTLNLLVRKGLLRELVLAEGRVVFDPKVDRHHHFIDEKTGAIHDIPWEAIRVSGATALDGYDVHAYQVVLSGTATANAARRRR